VQQTWVLRSVPALDRNLIRQNGPAQEQNVAPQVCLHGKSPVWGRIFGWALAYAVAVGGDNWCQIGCECGLDFDHRQGRLDGRLGRRLGNSCSLSLTFATALGLFSSTFLAFDSGSIRLTGMPGPPVSRSFSTSRAAVTSLGQAAGTSVRSLSGRTGSSKGANGESRLVDPTPLHGDTQIGPRRAWLPNGQAVGRWCFPPLLCADDMDADRPGPGGHMSAYLQHFTRARGCRSMK